MPDASGVPAMRHSTVATWARVIWSFGPNCPSLEPGPYPVMSPASEASCTQGAYQEFSSTSGYDVARA